MTGAGHAWIGGLFDAAGAVAGLAVAPGHGDAVGGAMLAGLQGVVEQGLDRSAAAEQGAQGADQKEDQG